MKKRFRILEVYGDLRGLIFGLLKFKKIVMRKIIAVWFSCGAPSAVASKLTIERYGSDCDVHIVNNPVDEEGEDNKRFLHDVEKWIGQPIISAVNTELGHTSAVLVWDKRQYMSGIHGAPCTGELKKKARYEYETKVKIDWHVLGYAADEKHRHDRFIREERENVLPILIEARLTKSMCLDIITQQGIKLPEAYLLGFPNANCFGCVKATSPTYWNHLRKMKPEIFNDRAEQSRRIGARLVRYKGKRIFLDELPGNAKGAKMKSYECGIFCDTK